jgi:hypothetical protein
LPWWGVLAQLQAMRIGSGAEEWAGVEGKECEGEGGRRTSGGGSLREGE